MSTQLKLNNYSSNNIIEHAVLALDSAVGALAITVQNANNISTNGYLLIGTEGSEVSELVQVDTVSGALVNLKTALKNKHSALENVSVLFGNKLTVLRAANVSNLQPADASFATFTGSLVDIDTDQLYTIFTDFNGTSDYWYKYVFTNATTSSSTDISGSTAARGAGFGYYATTDEIRREAGFKKAYYVEEASIDSKRQAAQSAIDSALVGFYTVPFTIPVNPLINQITVQLAAGLLLTSQFGIYDTRNTQNGKEKIEWAQSQLDKLQKGQLTLTDASGATTNNSSSSSTNGYPNAESSAIPREQGGTPPMFTTYDRY